MASGGKGRPCLRARLDGRERLFFLQPGVNRAGSLPQGEVVLPVKGVSRRHAVIVVHQDAVELRDLGSKNGTFHNGARASTAALRPGDVVELGGVRLTFEELPAPEDDLAIRFRPPPPPLVEPTGQETPLLDRDGELLAVAEELIDLLATGSVAHTARALRILVAACAAGGGLLGEWEPGREPSVLAACGDPGPWSAVEEALLAQVRAAGGGRDAGPTLRTARLAADQPYVCGGLSRPGMALSYLVVWGAAGERSLAEGLISIFLRLVDRFDRRPGVAAAPLPPGPLADLVMPPGYVQEDSRVMREVYAVLAELARNDQPVLFEGETGVGKECLVRILHASSARASRPLVAINCAAIPAELLEAELFGIRKGVATGVEERQGTLQRAAGGTLLLDEIADLPAGLQGKLLRVLQERVVEPLGGHAFPLDARVVSATNRDLEREVAAGRFRADLYYRLAGYVVRVPALRERRDDIPMLLECLVQRAADETGKWVRGITVQALRALVAHAWPGNVRELENEARRLVQRCPAGGAVDSSMLSDGIDRAAAAPVAPAGAEAEPEVLDLQAAIDSVERRLICRALELTGGHRTKAAALLGISRNGLAEKMERLGVGLKSVPR